MTTPAALGRELLDLDDDALAAYMAGLDGDELDVVEAALEAADIELAAERKVMPLGKAETFRRLGYEPICKPRVIAIRSGISRADAPAPCGQCPQERFHQANEFDVFFAGAAGPGKSRALVAEGLAAAMSYPGIRILGVRETFDALAESLLAELEKLDYGRALGAHWNATKHDLRFPNRSVIRFRHARTVEHAKLRMGGEYQLLLSDERGATAPAVVDLLMERLRSSRPEIPVVGVRSASNPGGPGHATLKARYVDATAHGAEVVTDEHRRTVRFIPGKATDNPYLNAEYLATLDAIPDPARRAAMRDGSWDHFVGQFFGQWHRDRHTVEPFTIPPEWARYEGIDYGRAAPWCVLWGAVDNDGRLWVYREIYETGVDESDQARRIVAAEAHDPTPRVRAADPSMWAKVGQSASIAESYRTAGCLITRANNNRRSGWARLSGYLAETVKIGDAVEPIPPCPIHAEMGWAQCPKLHVLRHACPNLIRTLPALGRSRIDVEDVDTAAEDHAADALRYLAMAIPQSEAIMTGRRTAQARIPTGVSASARRGGTLIGVHGHARGGR